MFIKSLYILKSNYASYQDKLEGERARVDDILKKEHYIKYHSNKWVYEQIKSRTKDNKLKLKAERDQRIFEQLGIHKLEYTKQCYKFFIEQFKKKAKQFVKEETKIILKETSKPSREFDLKRHMFPPYQTIFVK